MASKDENVAQSPVSLERAKPEIYLDQEKDGQVGTRGKKMFQERDILDRILRLQWW